MHVITFLSWAIIASIAQPASSPSTQPDAFVNELTAIDARAAKISDVTADFVQEKRSPMLRKPLVSRGTLKVKGSLTLWDTVAPEPVKMSLDTQTMRLFYPRQKVVEEYPMRGQLGVLAASPLPRLSVVREMFKVMPDDGEGLFEKNVTNGLNLRAVRMEPAQEDLKEFVDHARVLLDADRGLVLVFELVDPDGERTLIRFTNPRINTGLTDEQLQLDVPADVKVVRPTQGLEQVQPR